MWPLTYSDPGGTAEHLSTSATSTALAPQVPGSTALVPLSTAQRPRGAVHCYFKTHRHTALLCMYCSADIAGKGRHGWVVRWSGAAVQTNFSVDDLPGKGVQCACHMQGKQQSRNQKSSLFHIVRCRQVPCNYKLLHCNALLQCYTALHHCYTALRLPLLKYPFLAIFLLAHIQGWGDMLMRGQYKKGCDEQNLSGFDFVFARFYICSR